MQVIDVVSEFQGHFSASRPSTRYLVVPVLLLPNAEYDIISTNMQKPSHVLVTRRGCGRDLSKRCDVHSIPHASGIYQILCAPTGKVYVGSAVDLNRRWYTHRWDLRRGAHRNSLLQRAWDKYGADAFTFTVLEYVPRERLIEREQWHLDTLRSYDRAIGFNLDPVAGSRLGSKQPPEAVEKVRRANTGRQQSDQEREQKRESMIGRVISWGEKIAAAKRGKPRDEATRQKLSKANLGKKHPADNYRNHVKRWVIIDPDGNEYVIANLAAFCREMGLPETRMREIARGGRRHHKGWKCREHL